MIACITLNSNVVPLLEGLLIQIHVDLRLSSRFFRGFARMATDLLHFKSTFFPPFPKAVTSTPNILTSSQKNIHCTLPKNRDVF